MTRRDRIAQNVNWGLVVIIFIIIVMMFQSCENPMVEYTIEVDPQLEQDSNGYFHMTLDNNRWQTFNRFTGHVYREGKPVENIRAEWESDFYWVISDTAGYVVDYAYTDDLTYIAIDTSYIYFGEEVFLVPIINPVSLSNADGEFNTIFAPVLTQRGDTVSVYVNVLNDGINFNVILD
jgi:hypothetical protein